MRILSLVFGLILISSLVYLFTPETAPKFLKEVSSLTSIVKKAITPPPGSSYKISLDGLLGEVREGIALAQYPKRQEKCNIFVQRSYCKKEGEVRRVEFLMLKRLVHNRNFMRLAIKAVKPHLTTKIREGIQKALSSLNSGHDWQSEIENLVVLEKLNNVSSTLEEKSLSKYWNFKKYLEKKYGTSTRVLKFSYRRGTRWLLMITQIAEEEGLYRPASE